MSIGQSENQHQAYLMRRIAYLNDVVEVRGNKIVELHESNKSLRFRLGEARKHIMELENQIEGMTTEVERIAAAFKSVLEQIDAEN